MHNAQKSGLILLFLLAIACGTFPVAPEETQEEMTPTLPTPKPMQPLILEQTVAPTSMTQEPTPFPALTDTVIIELPTSEPTSTSGLSLSYDQLPEVIVSIQSFMVASPSHPEALIPSDPIPAGGRVRLVGRDSDGAWLLVMYKNVIGWIPVFYATSGISTLDLAIVHETLLHNCTTFLGTTLAPEEVWVSQDGGNMVAQGIIHSLQRIQQPEDSLLTVEVEGNGKVGNVEIDRTVLSPNGEALVFTADLEDLQPNSEVHFNLTSVENLPMLFRATFYSNDCQDYIAAQAQLPIYTSNPDQVGTPEAATGSTPVIIVVSSSSSETYISEFRLINADSDQVIFTLTDRQEIRLSQLPTTNLSIEAVAPSSWVSSVIFYLDGELFCMNDSRRCLENGRPFAMSGDIAGDYYANWNWNNLVGTHTISAVACPEDNGKGICATQRSITLTIRQ